MCGYEAKWSLLDPTEKGEGSSRESAGASDGSNDGRNEKEGDDDEGDDPKIDNGPTVLSVDQSAITGESLAVDKCTFLASLPPRQGSLRGHRHW